ncbi:MAG: hypothetical protein CMB00_06480 [Euryarchaeota archaeon]|nr:hypothetical protein [Euryarchaeota archaeon]
MTHSNTIWKGPVYLVISSEIKRDNMFTSNSVWVVFKLLFSHFDIACWATLSDSVHIDITIPFFTRAWPGHFLSFGNGSVEIFIGRQKHSL